MSDVKASLGGDDMLNLLPYFMEETRSRLLEIETHRRAILDRQNALGAIKAVRDLAHKISGTADTFGFFDLGVLARRVEDVSLADVLDPDDPAVLCLQMESAITILIQEMLKVLEPRKNTTTA